eukprot:1941118-Amphidinium_carterae.1
MTTLSHAPGLPARTAKKEPAIVSQPLPATNPLRLGRNSEVERSLWDLFTLQSATLHTGRATVPGLQVAIEVVSSPLTQACCPKHRL